MDLNSDNIEYIKLKIYEIFNKIQISEKIKSEIKTKIDLSKKYAVRSSGLKEDLSDFSFAGQYESFLNTEGLENIFKNIIESYKSMFSNTNLSYLINNNINYKDFKMAVIVQEMVDSDFSGIAFTINPLTGIDKEIVIEIAEGLGDKIVSGKIIPKNYIYNWYLQEWIEKEGKYLNKNILNEMIEVFLSIQIHFGFPCDIEFAINDNNLYILQARAITKINYTKITDQWTTADFKDGGVSATVCHPYMWSLYEYIWEYSFNLFLEEAVLFKTEDKLGDMFYGRPYWNLSKAKHGMSKIINRKLKN